MTFSAREPYEFSNGAIGWRLDGPFDRLDPYSKVQNCPIDGTNLRRTAYATGYADTYYSVPARTRVRGKWVRGYFTMMDEGCIFVPYYDQLHLLEG